MRDSATTTPRVRFARQVHTTAHELIALRAVLAEARRRNAHRAADVYEVIGDMVRQRTAMLDLPPAAAEAFDAAADDLRMEQLLDAEAGHA